MTQQLVIVRGLPGSGKSTFAQALASVGFAHYEADMFHMKDGVYVFDPLKVKEAHGWCQAQVKGALGSGKNVVVSNTFTQRWEMEPYLDFARAFGATAHIVQMTGGFKSIHNVPSEVIEKMRARWEAIE